MPQYTQIENIKYGLEHLNSTIKSLTKISETFDTFKSENIAHASTAILNAVFYLEQEKARWQDALTWLETNTRGER